MSWQLNVAAVQMRSIGDLAANLEVCRRLVGEAAAGGAKLVVLPECFSFLGAREGDKMAAAEVLDGSGPVMQLLGELCRDHGVWIIGGGTPETVEGDAKRAFNTCVVVDPTGRLVTRYRKIHLFDVDIPGGATLRESDGTVAGDDLEVVDIEGVPVGLSICYDLRFPELYRRLTQDLGAQVVVIPAAFTAHTGAAHWHVLMRARAIENQVWIVAAAQWGKHNEKRESYGHSLIVDPWGTIVAERAEGDGVIAQTLDGETVAKRRAQMPCGRHAVLWKR
ncbi:MAG: carbon-nitrogen hydrolase family protein [Deltaproteobacteria bacterium]